ncbi:MAG: RES family NAD+ phosphorylase [Candidatus Acidiferrales bacterium]
MAEFRSYRSYQRFAELIATQRRFTRNEEQAEFLGVVLATSAKRQEVIPAGSHLWRAQLGQSWITVGHGDDASDEQPAPLEPERMKPLVDRAREGRANPKGIPYLYTATQEQTAVAEVRPWIGSVVSVGAFELTRDLRVVNAVSDDRRIMVYSAEPSPEERERRVWRDIDRAFTRPVTSGDDTADYVPTQVLAEFFRESGLDGVAYGSSLGPGHNVVVFDPTAAELVRCDLVEISGVKLDVSMAANPYFMPPASRGPVGGT